jgi:chromosomal replication initiation ATPase DnaA
MTPKAYDGAIRANDPRMQAVRKRIGNMRFRSWISPLRVRVENDTLIVTAPGILHADTVRNRYRDLLLETFKVTEFRVFLKAGE